MKLRNNPAPYVMLFALMLSSHMVVSRFSMGQFEPLTFISLRIILTAVLTIAFFKLVFPKRKLSTDSRTWFHCGVYGILGTFLPLASFVTALQYQSSGVVSLFGSLNTAFTVLFAQMLLQDEKATWNKAIGIVVAFAGAGLLLMRGETGLADIARADWRAYLWIALALIGISLGPVYARRFMQDIDLVDVAVIRMIVASLLSIPIALLVTGYDMSHVTISGYIALIFITIFGTFLAFHFEFYIIQRFGATPVSQSSYLTPVFATIMGVIFLGEIVTPTMLVGMLIIFAGVALINRRAKATPRNKRVADPPVEGC